MFFMDIVDMNDPTKVHSMVCRLAKKRGALDHELGRWLLAAYRLRVHESLGFASFAEYVERHCGCSRREARERLRVAKALDGLPVLSHALQTGEIFWSAARELTRVATDETEREWLEAASGRTMRQVERMVVGHEEGARPLDKPSAEPPRRIVLDVTAPTWALLEEARQALTSELGGHVDDDVLVATLARAMLAGGGTRDEGRSAYQIALTVCDHCQTVTQRAGADDVVVDALTLEVAQCDATHVGRVDQPGSASTRATQTIPPRVRREVLLRHGKRCAVPGCRHAAFVHIHHTTRRADGGDHDPNLLLPLCDGHHTAAHLGTLVIGGTYSSGFTFTHADGIEYGAPTASPALSKVLAETLQVLLALDFRQRDAQKMIDRAKPHVGHHATVEESVRLALRQAPLPTGSFVREELATYERIVA